MRGFWGLTSGVRLQFCGFILPGLFRVGLLAVSGIVVLAALPGCGTLPEGAVAGGDAAAGTASPEVSYPRSVSAEDLKGLCKYTSEPGANSTVQRRKHYEEVDGRFELVGEDMIIMSIDANLNVHWVFMDENGVKYDETYYVDGFTYNWVSEDEADGWNVEASPGFWGDLIPDADDPVGPVGGVGGPSDGTGSTPGGDSEGSVGPTGRVVDLPDGSDTVCLHSPDELEDVTDYGMEMLDGVRVRHVGATVKSRPYDWAQMLVEYWVDSEGQSVQIKHTDIWASRGEYPASRSEGISTSIDRDPTILITAPAGAATPAAGP